MLIDETMLDVVAGKGGNGVVRFSNVKMSNGPTGGDGGRGGDVVLEGVADLGALRAYRSRKRISARPGGNGEQNTRKGENGPDAIIHVPVGTVATDKERENIYEILFPGQRIIVAKGGRGGFGNFRYRSSRHTTPDRANPGLPGEAATLALELKLIADIGLIGYPNAGKSSLLNALTAASSKVGNYRFTTLEPHLGAYYGTIIADIPGLIEGASEGRGLGHKFLRHIERTRVLFHLVSVATDDPVGDYGRIRDELGRFNSTLLEKPEYVLVSHADERTSEEVEAIVHELKAKNPETLSYSVIDDNSLKTVRALVERVSRVAFAEAEGA